jgi:sec-independent protein translocase protein TatC
MARNKDLFDDSVMSFGEHLEVLRIHLIRALLGLAVGVAVTLACGESIVRVIRQPIDRALNQYSQAVKKSKVEVTDNVEGFNFWSTVWTSIRNQMLPPDMPPPETDKLPPAAAAALQRVVTMEIEVYDFVQKLHDAAPQQFAAPTDDLKGKLLMVDAASDDFAGLRSALDKIDDPITLNVQEAFMTYIKVSLISGLILTSPWVIYQLWLFVAAGLYPHERKYVYTYLPTSIGLFLGGVVFCYYFVFPVMLSFLLGFNVRMGLTAQIRISEWINFAVMMPLLFGVSFQLPLVMLFLQKINVFQVTDYREKRRLAILGIAFLAMILTPTPDPMSMLLMMAPMLALYELGIGLCVLTRSPDELESAAPA